MQNGLVSKHNAMDPQNPIYFCDRQAGPVSPDYRKAKEHVSECEKPLKVKKVTLLLCKNIWIAFWKSNTRYTRIQVNYK